MARKADTYVTSESFTVTQGPDGKRTTRSNNDRKTSKGIPISQKEFDSPGKGLPLKPNRSNVNKQPDQLVGELRTQIGPNRSNVQKNAPRAAPRVAAKPIKPATFKPVAPLKRPRKGESFG